MRSALVGSRSVGGQVCALMLIIVTLLVLAAGTTLSLQARGSGDSQARASALTVARTVALAPGVQRALESRDPSMTLQPYAEKVRHRTDVDYIVVTSPRGIRWTHPVPKLLGRHIGRSLYPATAGRTFTDRLPGLTRSAPSIRAAVPVIDDRGRVIGIVNAGVSIPSVGRTVGRQLPMIYASTACALVLGGGGAALVARRLRRQTHRLDPAEITRMYEHHDAVLRSVKEGVLIVDDEGRLLLANDEALRLLGLTPDAHGRQITDVGLPPELAGLLASGRAATGAVHQVEDRLLAVNQCPAERRRSALGERGHPAGHHRAARPDGQGRPGLRTPPAAVRGRCPGGQQPRHGRDRPGTVPGRRAALRRLRHRRSPRGRTARRGAGRPGLAAAPGRASAASGRTPRCAASASASPPSPSSSGPAAPARRA
ncbi:hypothetical protein SANTM175S_02246 [Streptomyces antimycoticus]